MSSRWPRVADDDIGGLAGREIGKRFVEILRDDLKRVGETLGVGVGFAIVGNDAVESRVAGGFEELEGHVACAEDVKQRHGQHRLDKDLERAAADQAGVVLRVLVEIEGEGARLFLRR